MLRKSVLFLLCLLAVSILGCSRSDPILHDNKGKEVQLSRLQGKWVVVNIWASWCTACIYETPELNRFYDKTKGTDIELYGVNFDQVSGNELTSAINKMHITYPNIVEDANYAWRMGNVTVLPTTFILNPRGKLAKMIVGETSEKKLLETIAALKKDYH